MSLLDLPDELIFAVLYRARALRSLVWIGATCWRLRRLCDDAALWRTVASRAAQTHEWIALVNAAARAHHPGHGLARLVAQTTICATVRYQNACIGGPSLKSISPSGPESLKKTICTRPRQAPTATAFVSMVAWVCTRPLSEVHVWMLSADASSTPRLVHAPQTTTTVSVSHERAWWKDLVATSLGRTSSVSFVVVSLAIKHRPHGTYVVSTAALRVPECVTEASPDGIPPFASTWYADGAEFCLQHREFCRCNASKTTVGAKRRRRDDPDSLLWTSFLNAPPTDV